MGRVAIAGASGFIGTALREALLPSHEIVGLTRSPRANDATEWRRCDLYSLLDAERALEGCDYAIYLVHSMMPSARLTQASFKDLDLILADNFGRAAARAGVKQIIYLGGLVPDTAELSEHLASRLEVEHALSAHDVPVTALRAGLVVGAGGSSLHILTSLVRRLPAMVTPSWTLSPTQPIALCDVVRAVTHVLGRPDEFRGAFDIGGPDVMSYRDMMQRTARALGVKRPMAPVPLFTPALSTLWVSLVTGSPMALVGPLVQSLKHAMVVSDNPVQRWLVDDALGFDECLRQAIAAPRAKSGRVASVRERKTVRSIQRLPRPPGASARWIAEEYVRWLPRVPIPGLRTESEGRVARFFIMMRRPMLILRLSEKRGRNGRALFYIDGGLLVERDERLGRFEFRLTPDGEHVIAAIHDFRPRLPWTIYKMTQAIAHLWVMRAFGAHLARIDGAIASGGHTTRTRA